jgi:dolichol-phosphate mannosyltransferase
MNEEEDSTMSVTHSIIVPAYKEAGNLQPLTRRVFAAVEKDGFKKGTVELIIVDDNSRDGSVEAVDALKKEGYNVQILVRTKERGLSSAVLHGFKNSTGKYMLVMDADLQHPPEYVPKLLRSFEKPGVEYVLGTRYGAGVAIDKDWPVHRRVISWGARLLARPLTPLSDPMSGFFGLRRDVYSRGERDISAIGYKIALELFVKCRVKKYEEVSFSFAARVVGESKLTGKVIVHYLKHLRTLYQFAYGLWIIVFAVLLLLAALSVIL